MRLTAAQLNRATLDRQLLLRRHDLDPVAALRRVLALQGQEPAAPFVALWARVADFEPSTLARAYADGRVARATLMRVTLHVVATDDHPVLHAAMHPRLRASRVNDRRFREAGLAPEEADEAVATALAATAEPVTADRVTAALAAARGEEPHERLWWAVRTYAPILRAPTRGPWCFDGPIHYVAADGAGASPGPRPPALRHLVERYLRAFGPATVADVAQFTLLTRSSVREAVADLGEEVVRHEGPDGAELLDVAGATVPGGDEPAPPRLLGMWDSTLFAYHDRARVLPAEHRADVIRRNGDTLPAVLVDGHVRGVWRQVPDGIEVTPFVPYDDATWDGLAEEATGLHAMLVARDAATFGRHRRWWDRLPDRGRRVIGT